MIASIIIVTFAITLDIILICFILANVELINNKYVYKLCIFIIILLSIGIGGAIEDATSRKLPKAIDVYRGNTTLKITNTVVDSVIVKSDTLVVFNVKQ